MYYDVRVKGKLVKGLVKSLPKARVIAAKFDNAFIIGFTEQGDSVYSEWMIWTKFYPKCYVERSADGGKKSYSKINPKTGEIISTSKAYRGIFY